MKKTTFTLIIFLISSYAYSCSCSRSIGSYFLNEVKKFDAIVEGKFYREPVSGQGFLILDKVYKGNILRDRIKIYEGGTDCTEIFSEDFDETYIIGLYKFGIGNNIDTFIAPSCVVSVLTVRDKFVFSEHNLHIKPKINFFQSKMKKDKLVKKVKNRI